MLILKIYRIGFKNDILSGIKINSFTNYSNIVIISLNPQGSVM